MTSKVSGQSAIKKEGMLLLGVLGASVGFGLQQIMQILCGQSVGLLKGEWKGISGKAPRIMVFAIINISSTKTGGFPNEKNN